MKRSKSLAKPESLDVMTWAGIWGDSLQTVVSARFTELTGIRVQHHFNIGLRLPDMLIDSLRTEAHSPLYDVVWSNAVQAVEMANLNHCARFDESNMTSLDELHQRARPAMFEDRVVFPYSVQYVLVYSKEVEPYPPQSWEVLLDRRHAGKIAIYPKGKGLYPIAQVLGGGCVQNIPDSMQPCWTFLAELRPRIAVLDYSVGMEPLIKDGSVTLCFRALPNALRFIQAGLDIGWTVPQEGTSDTTDALWIPRNVTEDRHYWAQKYINFALSASVQTQWCKMLGVMPANKNAERSVLFDTPGFPADMDDNTGILHIQDQVAWQHEAEWESIFDRLPTGETVQ